jgi:hypothetical protein
VWQIGHATSKNRSRMNRTLVLCITVVRESH